MSFSGKRALVTGTPDEVAEATVYLAGAELVTGTILSIDGGLTAT
jgi:NAD(P)-dependent dehydrogenase (short-subunit alcohol dehydrogenase family)